MGKRAEDEEESDRDKKRKEKKRWEWHPPIYSRWQHHADAKAQHCLGVECCSRPCVVWCCTVVWAHARMLTKRCSQQGSDPAGDELAREHGRETCLGRRWANRFPAAVAPLGVAGANVNLPGTVVDSAAQWWAAVVHMRGRPTDAVSPSAPSRRPTSISLDSHSRHVTIPRPWPARAACHAGRAQECRPQ